MEAGILTHNPGSHTEGVLESWFLMYLVYYVRWMKNQLSHDEYVVDGRVFRAFRIVTNDLTLPPRNVRFRKETVNVGNGPTLEGHSYLKTFINGRFATVQRELLVVEFNGRLERQRRPLPACGTPRS